MNRVTKLGVVVALACAASVQAVNMEWVTVGDPGNMPDDEVMRWDKTTGYGSVAYTYMIGKYEVTNAQYAEFLNAVAASDPNGLYNTEMGTAAGGIERTGEDGGYTYHPMEGHGNMPVNFVGWYDTLRFANWMHNGQPTGDQHASTTEDGAYDMSLGANVVRKAGARVFLPSEDEWYKAAYYKRGGTDAGYWNYPTQSDTPPTPEGPPGTDFTSGSANYFSDLAVAALIYVGSYTAKPSGSAYRTFDQGANVWEWNEALIGENRGFRGGSFIDLHDDLHANYRQSKAPTFERSIAGFRVAALPVLDDDDDVDLRDYALFHAAITGPR